jgi:2-polyprenyl-3-methyl-5-hydroxy-6-metoxy-1,4-benzoquinol methylase
VTSLPLEKRAGAPDASRFAFGRNWESYLGVLSEDRIVQAMASLEEMIGTERIAGATFLDVGSGSGLFSLAASRLGARRIHSFDFDPDSVACTEALRNSCGAPDTSWTVERGSALDEAYLASLGEWDIVYSWGVLHHTGAMWAAIDRVTRRVRPGGLLFISIYNDQGPVSEGWKAVKRSYNRGRIGKLAVLSAFVPYFVGRGLAADLLRLRNPVVRYREYRRTRGMSMFHDWMDWLGGYPFEVARPEEIFDFCQARGFVLQKMKTCGGKLGCNEFVFLRTQRLEPPTDRGDTT